TKKIINQYSPNAPFSFNLLIPFNSETLEIAESIQALLSQSGVNMNIQQLEWSAFKGRLTDGNFDAFILSWWADYPDGENFLYPLFHSSNIGSGGNYTGYNNETVDDLINRSQSIYKTDDRNELFHKIQLNIINDAPMFFLYQSKSYTVTQAWVEGYSPHPLYNGNNMSDVAIVRKIKNS
ncbi:MAG: ABC transporter substrate-binding protein, partial [Chlamydiota bacterium]|nr:ABC transporter substrate-binding protein [Chlamydiota bacterium]